MWLETLRHFSGSPSRTALFPSPQTPPPPLLPNRCPLDPVILFPPSADTALLAADHPPPDRWPPTLSHKLVNPNDIPGRPHSPILHPTPPPANRNCPLHSPSQPTCPR